MTQKKMCNRQGERKHYIIMIYGKQFPSTTKRSEIFSRREEKSLGRFKVIKLIEKMLPD